ncbi:MAG: hypothetical protein KA974_04370 [Saprospiraceae bacterium]|nr:hypothetical protein [Saprospiraceae bacterium]MBP7679526.1 hypothetical protein [Saprospiraceae bacterium]
MFETFLQSFPLVKFPVTIREDTYQEMGENNPPLGAEMIAKYLACFNETGDDDEMTEYIACFSLPKANAFVGVIFWKAGLLTYDYFLATYTHAGMPLDCLRVAGTTVERETIIQAIATIRDDWNVNIIQGRYAASGAALPVAANSKPSVFEVLDDGKIVQLI